MLNCAIRKQKFVNNLASLKTDLDNKLTNLEQWRNLLLAKQTSVCNPNLEEYNAACCTAIGTLLQQAKDTEATTSYNIAKAQVEAIDCNGDWKDAALEALDAIEVFEESLRQLSTWILSIAQFKCAPDTNVNGEG